MDERARFTMFGDCVLVKPIIKKKETSTLIRQNEADTSASHFGEVISVSSEITNSNYDVGSIVIFDLYSAEQFVDGNIVYYIAHTKDIFAVMKEENHAN